MRQSRTILHATQARAERPKPRHARPPQHRADVGQQDFGFFAFGRGHGSDSAIPRGGIERLRHRIGHLGLGPGRVDHSYARGLARRDRKVSPADSLKKVRVFGFDPVVTSAAMGQRAHLRRRPAHRR